MGSEISHYVISHSNCDDESQNNGGSWVEFQTPTPNGKLIMDPQTKEWIWTDSVSFTLYHTLYTAENHIAFVENKTIYLHRILM